MSISSGCSPRRGMKAGKGIGPVRRASLGTSRGRQPNPKIQSVPAALNAENSSPSSKTVCFIGSGRATSWMTGSSGGSSGGPSPSTGHRSSRIPQSDVTNARCRRSRRVLSGSVCHGLAGRRRNTGQQRAGNRGSGMPSKARPTGSTSWASVGVVRTVVCGSRRQGLVVKRPGGNEEFVDCWCAMRRPCESCDVCPRDGGCG
jgi:hypothetical protein